VRQAFQERVFSEGNELFTAQKYEEAISSTSSSSTLIRELGWNYNMPSRPGPLHPAPSIRRTRNTPKRTRRVRENLELTRPVPRSREDRKFYLSFLDSTGDEGQGDRYLKNSSRASGDLALINQIRDACTEKGRFHEIARILREACRHGTEQQGDWYTIGVNCWARSYKGGAAVSQEEREQVVEKGIKALERALSIDPTISSPLLHQSDLSREGEGSRHGRQEAEAGQAYAKADEYQKRAIDLRKAQAAKGQVGLGTPGTRGTGDVRFDAREHDREAGRPQQVVVPIAIGAHVLVLALILVASYLIVQAVQDPDVMISFIGAAPPPLLPPASASRLVRKPGGRQAERRPRSERSHPESSRRPLPTRR